MLKCDTDPIYVHGIGRFVLASSSRVYGPETLLPAREDGPTAPCSPYALTKLQGEQWGRLYARLHGLRFVALLFFSVWDFCVTSRNASAPTLPWSASAAGSRRARRW